MGKTIQFHPRETENERYHGANGVVGKSISINRIKENNPHEDNGSDFDITELLASKSDGANFDIMNLLASQNPELKKKQELIEKYEKIKSLKGSINKKIYNERLDSLREENVEDLEERAKSQGVEGHPAYAMALFHTIFRKRKKNRGFF